MNRSVTALFARRPQQVGLSVGVFRDGRVETFNFGEVEKGHRVKPTAQTLYRIASITKTFTSTLLAQAAVEDKLHLDDDIRKYLPGTYPNLEFQGKAIELQFLTNHRSGLPFILPDKPEAQPDYPGEVSWSDRIRKLWKGYTRADFNRDLHEVTLAKAPNSNSSYSNAATQLLGYILESKYHLTFEELVKKKIAIPLKMWDTTISVSKAKGKRLAVGYDAHGERVADVPDDIQGAGALKSTVADLMEYLQWEIAETDRAVKLTHRSVFSAGEYSAGLNWQMWQKGGRRLIWQSGSFPGYQSLLIMEPELHIGLVLLGNEQEGASSRNDLEIAANEILKSLDSRVIPLP